MEVRYCLLKDKTISLKQFNEFKKLVPEFLKDLEKKYKIKYKLGCVNCSHLHVILACAELTNSVFKNNEKNNEEINFSWTDQKSNIIMFCFENWRDKYLNPSNEEDLYKRYVVLHEFLHAFPFYLGHVDSVCNDNGGYNVMYQQTRIACNKNGIPKKECKLKKIILPDLTETTYNLKNEYAKWQDTEAQELKRQSLKKIQSIKIPKIQRHKSI